jgi:hypothetical protein
MAPPVHSGTPFMRPQGTKWPNVIGVICIVIGALGTIFGILGLVSQVFLGKVAQMMPAEEAEPLQHVMEVSELWKSWTSAAGVLAALVAILLIVGGAKLTRRRSQAMGLLKTYAVLRIPVALFAAAINYKIQIAIYEASGTMPGSTTTVSESAFRAIAAGQFAFSAIWGSALPIFLLIWFARARIKDEVRRWDEASVTP